MGLVILCPGQGAQHAAMFATLTADPLAREVIEAASELVDLDLLRLETTVPGERLFDNAIAQPLVCAAALGAWHALSSRIDTPLAFAGYSIGELAAYGCAGALGFIDTLRLAQRRAALMDACARATGGMLALRGLNEAHVRVLCDGRDAAIAIANADDHFVVGGAHGVLEEIAERAAQQGAHTVRRLPVSIVSHTAALSDAASAFETVLGASGARDPDVPVLAGIDGSAIHGWPRAIQSLAAQLRQTIRWDLCTESAIERGATAFFELGPGAALSRMLQQSHPEIPARSFADFRSISGAARWIESVAY
ncbi:ACP S-malonyltransferase [Caballeronia pedi]|uniref:ACP S-malonyltransferase n=1 Tax=Caballeronia pedi TaxID=1777141 RepID=A0A157ZMJ2_9BURK|nr:acyltransferase domain-containing protein [Caballeronia pedi]SAK46728.1 ACP S-malonyltransferase [Caballeronia pedi]